MEGSEKALNDLETWLKSVGCFIQVLIEAPEERELGGKLTALTLLFALVSESSHLPLEVEEGLQAVLR